MADKPVSTIISITIVVVTIIIIVSIACRGLAGPGRGAEGSRGPLQPDQDSGQSQVAAVSLEGRFGARRAEAPCGAGWGQLRLGRSSRRRGRFAKPSTQS